MMANTYAAKRALDLQKSAGIHDHPLHDQLLCNYSDAAAKDVQQIIEKELPKMVSDAIDDYMNSQRVQVKVDEASVKSVKNKISELISSLFR